jgi:uncharacterized protein YecE (DUF72 family)
MNGFRVGTSGWSYKHWAGGVFYPADVKSAKWLEYYLTQFDCTELNASFYRLPEAKTVDGWRERVPADFKFCPKLSRWITQLKKLKDPAEPLKTFFDRFEPLRERLGPVLVQLPPNFGYDAARTEFFYTLLREHYAAYRFALEARHESWFSPASLDLMRQYRIALVIADSGTRFPHNETITADWTYLRFHGPDGLYASNYAPEQLAGYADKIKAWLEQGLQVWAFFNNDAQGYAPKNARQLRDLVKARTKFTDLTGAH